MTTYAEERVLKPLNPVPEDVNEWPDFGLREVKIFYQGKGRYADLLEASPEVPLCVVGELMPLDDEQEDLALIDNPTYVRLKIDSVSNYSFGQDDSGKPVIWAAGKAGWYEITPSDRYQQHYNDTIEAIDLFYFMVDQFQKLPQKRKRLGFMIDPFLTAYQKHTDFRVDDDDEAMETIHKHHKFLLKQMIEEREDIDWSQTRLWNHLARTYPDEIKLLRKTLATYPTIQEQEGHRTSSSYESSDEDERPFLNGNNKDVSQPKGQSTTSDESSESGDGEDDESDEANEISKAETASKKSSTADSASEDAESDSGSESSTTEGEQSEEDDRTDWTRPIFDLLNVLRKSSSFDIRNCGIEQLATEVTKLPTFKGSHKKATTTIERCAEPLLRLMNEAKLRKKFNWSTRAIFAELEATLADEIAEDIRTPAPGRGKGKHRMKSVLRPSGAMKSRKRARGTQDDEDEDMTDEPPVVSAAVRRHPQPKAVGRTLREQSLDSVETREDSPSRQLNGQFDSSQLVELPPGPEAQEMLDLVQQEGRRVGRQNQTNHLQAFLVGWEW